MNAKTKYRDLAFEKNLSIFCQPWWLDAVCGERNWDVVILEEPDGIVAALPYYVTKKYGLACFLQPPLTQSLGPWIASSQSKYAKQLSRQKKLMGLLIENLPPYDYFCQNFHYSITNWLPFYWKEFSQQSRYTYVLDDLSALDRIWDGFQAKARTDIRKAQKTLKVRSDFTIDIFLDLHKLTFTRQNLNLPYSQNLVRRIDAACEKNDARKIFYAVDNCGQIYAAVYIIWDKSSAYYLMSGSHPDFRRSGATSLLLWEAIKFSSTVTEVFDFEGSMLEPIERFVRGFGAKQVAYSRISRMNKRTKLLYSIREFVKASKNIIQ